MSTSISGISLTGVFSNIDTDKLVQATVLASRGPLNRLTRQKSDIQARQAAFADIESRLNDLEDITAKLRSAATLRAVSGTSSNTGVLSVSTSGGAAEGTFQVVVNQLATAHRLIQTVGADGLDSLVGAGQFVYSYNGTTRTRATTADTTLEGLRDLINNDSANPGLTASILHVNGTYHLVLSGKDSGADHDITIDDVQTTLSGFDTADFTQTQAAQSAQVRVDGFPAGSWIERDTNSISDVIPGTTLNLAKAGEATVTLTRNSGELTSDINNLVNIYNGLAGKISDYSGYDAENHVGGVLQGDITLRAIADGVRSLLSGALKGFQAGTDAYAMASDIGLTFDKNGKITLDQTKFSEALTADYLGVLQLMGASGSGRSTSSYIQFTEAQSSTAPGPYNVEVHFGANGVITTARIRKEGDSDWRNMDIEGDTLAGQTGQAEAGLRLTGIWPGGGESTQTGTVYVQEGLAGQINDMVTAMLKPLTGTMAVSKTRFDTQLQDIDRRIENQNKYLTSLEQRLKEKYARMEATLASLDSLRGQFDALFTSLDNNSRSQK